MKGMRQRVSGFLLTGVLILSGSASADVLDDAAALIKAGKGIEAYALLKTEEDARLGNSRFDYLFGLAAADAGKGAEAVFALERVLDADPGNTAARAELARAYYLLGENEAAKKEFEQAQGENPSDGVQATIDKFLSAIEHRFEAGRISTTAWLEAGVGYDSNVNSATGDSTVAIPALGNVVFTLDATGTETDSGIFNFRSGFQHSRAIRENLNFYGGGSIDTRTNLSADAFNTMNMDVNLGLHSLRGQDQIRVSVQAQRFILASALNRKLYGLNGQWQRTIDAANQITVFGQSAALRYPGQRVRNANTFTGGVAWARALGGKGSPVVFLSGFAGTEDEKSAVRPDLGRDFYGVRIGGQYTVNDRVQAVGGLRFQRSDYGGADPLFLVTRDDKQWDLNAGINYKLTSDWTLKPLVSWSRNNSNIPINDYDRFQVAVTARHTFD